MTRAALITQNNTNIKSNGIGAITGPILNAMVAAVVNDAVLLDDTNTMTGPLVAGGGFTLGSQTVADTAYTLVSGVQQVAYTSLTATRLVTLLASNQYTAGTRVEVVDESGSCSATVRLTIAVAAGDSLNGVLNGTTSISVASGRLFLDADGVSGWWVSREQLVNVPAGTVLGNPTAAAAPPQPTSDMVGYRNILGNGGFSVDQRGKGNSVALTTGGYTTDRWIWTSTQAGSKFSHQINSGSITPPAGFGAYAGFLVSSAFTVGASDVFNSSQIIEASDCTQLAWGTSSAKTVTLSFWAYSTVAGLHGGFLRNVAATRSYTFSFTLPGSTWTYVSVVVPGDATGTWVTSGVAGSLQVGFNLGAGASARTAAGSWTAGNFSAPTGGVNVVATAGGRFNVTGVQLEVGAYATAYEHLPFSVRLARCQRYYWDALYLGGTYTHEFNVYSPSIGSNTMVGFTTFPVSMRTNVPTVSLGPIVYSGCNSLTWSPFSTASGGFIVTTTVSGMLAVTFAATFSADF